MRAAILKTFLWCLRSIPWAMPLASGMWRPQGGSWQSNHIAGPKEILSMALFILSFLVLLLHFCETILEKGCLCFLTFDTESFVVGLDGWEVSLINGGQPHVLLAGVTFLWDKNFGNLTAGYARPWIFLLWSLFLFKPTWIQPMNKSAPCTDISLRVTKKALLAPNIRVWHLNDNCSQFILC